MHGRSILHIARLLVVTAAVSCGGAVHARPTPLGSTITYQGQLRSSGAPYNGTADFTFALFDAASAGTQIGSTLAANAVVVTNGTFMVSLDFGALAFNGDNRWLEIAVRTPAGGPGAFTTLTPRQPFTAVPYALRALNASVSGAQPNLVTFSNAGNGFTGSSLAIDGSTLRVDSISHNVGIGTASPQALLHLSEAGTGQPMLRLDMLDDVATTLALRTPFRDWRIGQNQPPDSPVLDSFYVHDATAGLTRLLIDTNGNVGIGTVAPASKLDVAGTVTAAAIALPPTTRHLSIPSNSFVPEEGGYNYGVFSQAYLYGLTPGEALIFFAPVQLPDGAVITTLAVQVFDDASVGDITVQLRRTDGTPVTSLMGLVSSSGASASGQTLTVPTIGLPIVDNLNYSYSVRVDWTTPTTLGAIRLYRVVITYTVTSPLP